MNHENDRRKYKIQWETLIALGGFLVAFASGGWKLYTNLDTRLRNIEIQMSAVAQEIHDMSQQTAYNIPFRSRIEVPK